MNSFRFRLVLVTVFFAGLLASSSNATSLVKLKMVGFSSWDEPMEVPFSSWDEPMEVPFSSWDEPMEVPLASTRTTNFLTRLELKHKIAALAGSSKFARRKKGRQRKLLKGKVKIECSSCNKKMVQKLTRKTAELANCAYYCKALTKVSLKGMDVRLQTHRFCAKCNKKGERSAYVRYRFAGQKSYQTAKVDQDVLRALVFVVHGKGNAIPKDLLRKVKTIFKL